MTLCAAGDDDLSRMEQARTLLDSLGDELERLRVLFGPSTENDGRLMFLDIQFSFDCHVMI